MAESASRSVLGLFRALLEEEEASQVGMIEAFPISGVVSILIEWVDTRTGSP